MRLIIQSDIDLLRQAIRFEQEQGHIYVSLPIVHLNNMLDEIERGRGVDLP